MASVLLLYCFADVVNISFDHHSEDTKKKRSTAFFGLSALCHALACFSGLLLGIKPGIGFLQIQCLLIEGTSADGSFQLAID